MILLRAVERQLVHEVTDASFQLVALTEDFFQLGNGETWPIRVVGVDDDLISQIRGVVLTYEQKKNRDEMSIERHSRE